MKVPASDGHDPCSLTLKELKRTTYCILRKMHDLERGRKVARIYGTMCSDSPCLLVCLRSLRESLVSGLSIEPSAKGHSEMLRYLDMLDSLIERVDVGVVSGRAIERGYVSDLLTAHTSLFRVIEGQASTVQLAPELWSNVVLPAVAIWKNGV